MRVRLACLFLALVTLMPQASVAATGDDDSPLGLSYVETKDLKLVYFDSLGHLVPHAVRTFSNSHAWQRRTFGWTPSGPVGVLLKDAADYGGGSAWIAPRNTVFVDVAPLSLAFETYPASERMYSIMNHELVHVATGDGASSQDRFWRGLFLGKVPAQSQNPESLLYNYLTVPRFAVPRWHLEGSAVFMETWMGGGLGRAQGGYDEMVFRAMVRDGLPFYDPLGLVSKGVLVDFQVGANAYLYGTRFFTWLAYAHSPEQVVAWLSRDEGSRRHYADQFEQVFGLRLERAWDQWIAFERDFQQRNLAKVRENPVTAYRPLKGAALGSISRTFYDDKTGILYGAFRTPGVVEHVGALDTRNGNYRILTDIKRAMLFRVASFAFDPASGTAFFTNNNLAERDLMAVDVKTGEQRLIFKGARIGELAFNAQDRSLWGVRHHQGYASIVRLLPPYTVWTSVRDFSYGVMPSDLDISPDGKLLSASVSEVNADQFVRVWSLDKLLAGGDARPISEFGFGQSVPESFTFSRDGRFLYGSSYYTGASNIFRYEVANGAVEAVSNAETGFFRPQELPDGRLLVLAYTGAGFEPAIIDAKPIADISAVTFLGAEVAARHKVVTTWQVPSPATVDDGKLVTKRGPYAPLRQMGLQNAYPVLQGYKNTTGLGYRVNFGDTIQFARLSATIAVTPNPNGAAGNERLHLDINGDYLGWRVALAYNKSDFYDLFGPTKRSRKGSALRLGYDHLLIYDEPRKLTWSNDISWRNGIDTLPEAQNVGSGFTRLVSAESKLAYADLRRSLGAVDDEKGLAAVGLATLNRAGDRSSSQLRGGFDFGLALPWAHSSLWLRSAAGVSQGDASDPVASYYFGGFGNNRVDNGPVKRYREVESMPGFELNAIPARRFAKQTVEWTLPPLIYESVGLPAFHLTWLRPAVFATALRTSGGTSGDGSAGSRNYVSLGGQIDLRFSVQHWNEMFLSIGAATGYRGSQRVGNEWMISLKIM